MMRTGAVWLGILVVPLFGQGFIYSNEGDSTTFILHSQRKVGQVDQVNILLEAEGDILLKTGPKGEKTEKVAMAVSCRREYDEKTLAMPGKSTHTWRSIRSYNDAKAIVKKGDALEKPELRPDRRLVGVEITGPKVKPFCPRGPLNLDELELIIAAGESLPVDQLLPEGKVSVDQKWKTPDDMLAILLGLEEITTNSVETALTEVTPEVARLELNGQVEGKLYGAANQIELKAKCRFNRKMQRIDWLAIKVKQTREIGLVEDGVDVTVLVQMKITPKNSSDALSDAALKGLPLKPTDDLCKLVHESKEGGWQCTHDRQWFLIDHFRDLDVFHRVDHGQDLGMCKISPMPKVDPGKVVTLKQFQADVQRALGKNFGEFIEAGEAPNDANCRVYHVVVKGSDGESPAQWFYYLVSDAEGHQAALAFRIEEKRVEAFGRADKQIVRSMKFVEKK